MREIKFRAFIKKINKIGTWEQIKKECNRLTLLELDDKNEGEFDLQPLYPQERKTFNKNQYTNLPLNFNEKEVIGNIYENKELL